VIATDAMEVRSAVALQTVWNIGPADISVCALPLSYTFGMFSASYAAFCAGACVLLLPKFHPVSVLEAIQAERATYMVGVPTMYAMMLEHTHFFV
jgi:long-chain acyl-CoA synthetase